MQHLDTHNMSSNCYDSRISAQLTRLLACGTRQPDLHAYRRPDFVESLTVCHTNAWIATMAWNDASKRKMPYGCHGICMVGIDDHDHVCRLSILHRHAFATHENTRYPSDENFWFEIVLHHFMWAPIRYETENPKSINPQLTSYF